jgi:hypothetical protein
MCWIEYEIPNEWTIATVKPLLRMEIDQIVLSIEA